MHICFICEGSYPYIAGGVASWVQMVIKAFPQHSFSIWSIATTKEEMSTYRYELPENVTEVKTFYLGETFFSNQYKKVRLKHKEKQVLEDIIIGKPGEVSWKEALELIMKYREHLTDLLMSEDFFDITLKLYQSSESRTPFNEYLWNLRGMYFPFMSIMSDDLIKADLYHSVSTGYAGMLGSVASFIYKKPYLLSEHGIYTREREEDIIRSNWLKGEFKELWIDFFKKISMISYHQASIVTSLFETNREIQIELGCPKEKIRVIPNGVEIESFEHLKERTEESKEYFNIGAVLRIVPIKDVKTMLLAYLTLKKKVPASRLYILGNYDENPEYYGECLELTHEMNITDVYFTGQVNIKDYLKQFDLLLLTSISEGQPLAILEGMAAGLPFVCTNVGDCKNLLKGNAGDELGNAGFIVPVMDVRALADKLIFCEAHRSLLKDMGETARKRVEKYYQKKDFLLQYEELYNQLGGV